MFQNLRHRGRAQDPDDDESDDETVGPFPPVPSGSRPQGGMSSRVGAQSPDRPLPGTPPSRKPAGVSALIEKYASLSTSPGGSPAPSRLPVRASSLSKDLPAAGVSKETPLPREPEPEDEGDLSSSHEFPRPLSESDDLTPLQTDTALTPNQTSNLVRYIHGAPLHNLPEDPEEED